MVKAQSFFGGTEPKETGKRVRQVGHKGSVQNRTGSIARRDTVKQAKSSPAEPHIQWVDSKQPKDVGSAR